MDRRTLFQQLAPAAALVASELGASAQAVPAAAEPVSRDALREALKLIGLSFPDEQLDLMRANVVRAQGSMAALRQLTIPLDTDPAFHFDPLLPGTKAPTASPFVPPAPKAPRRFGKLEEAAYWSIPDLAALIRTRRASSRDLTRMYLDRLRQHAETLHCVVTLTEELAMEQAARADSELRRGRYRGLLHGLPYGAKDLFATKGIRTTWGAEPFKDQIIDHNATIIEKLQQAGAVLVAKWIKALHGLVGVGRLVVWRHDAEPLEYRKDVVRFFGRFGGGDRGGPGGLLDWYGDTRLHPYAKPHLRRHRAPANLWPRLAVRRHEPLLDDG